MDHLAPHLDPPLPQFPHAHHPRCSWARRSCRARDHQHHHLQNLARSQRQMCVSRRSPARRARTYRGKAPCAALVVYHRYPDATRQSAQPACHLCSPCQALLLSVAAARFNTGGADPSRTRAHRLCPHPRIPTWGVMVRDLARCRSWRSWRASRVITVRRGTARTPVYPLNLQAARTKVAVC